MKKMFTACLMVLAAFLVLRGFVLASTTPTTTSVTYIGRIKSYQVSPPHPEMTVGFLKTTTLTPAGHPGRREKATFQNFTGRPTVYVNTTAFGLDYVWTTDLTANAGQLMASDVWSSPTRTVTGGTVNATVDFAPVHGRLTNISTAAARNQSATQASFSDIAASVWGWAARTLSGFGSLVSDIWSSSTRTVTGGTVDIASSIGGVPFRDQTGIAAWADRRMSRTHGGGAWGGGGGGGTAYVNVTTIEQHLALKHGGGAWGATVTPFAGNPNYVVTQGKDVHIPRGDTVLVPYSIGKDLTGHTFWHGAKLDPNQTAYNVPLREITSRVTDFSTGTGMINYSSTWTNRSTIQAGKRYYGEVQARRGTDSVTVMKYYLWVDPRVIQ